MAVKELLGHESIEMTLRYSHLSPDVKRDALKLLDTPAQRSNGNLTVETIARNRGPPVVTSARFLARFAAYSCGVADLDATPAIALVAAGSPPFKAIVSSSSGCWAGGADG
jgi:hypothetical protein